MSKTQSVKGKARELVLDTAERLFAEQGVKTISLRAINAAAGVSPSVLHYHFGNRDTLVIAVIERRMPELMEQRGELLSPLLHADQPELQSIIEALVLPLADFVLNGGEAGQRYIRFMARLYADRSPLLEQVSQQYIPSITSNFPKLIAKACPHLSHDSICWRLNMANHCSLQTLADLQLGPRLWQSIDNHSMLEQTEDLIRFITSGFQYENR